VICAVRSQLRSPAHTAIALLTLALGIGVNPSMVSGVSCFDTVSVWPSQAWCWVPAGRSA
jgi:hypothetical protein